MVLPDLLAPGLRVVFCGTAPGAVSARRGAYYAGPGNRFWPMLAETGLTPLQFVPEAYPRLLAHGIGLTDLAKTVSGADASLPRDAFDRARLRDCMRRFRPGMLAFTSKRAAAEFLGTRTTLVPYGPLTTPDMPPLFVLPSPSGLARGSWSPQPWHDLAALIRRKRAE